MILLAGNTVSLRGQPFVKTLKHLCPVHIHTVSFLRGFRAKISCFLHFPYLRVDCCLDLYYTIVIEIAVSRCVIVFLLFFFYSSSCSSPATAVPCGPCFRTHSSCNPSGLLPLYTNFYSHYLQTLFNLLSPSFPWFFCFPYSFHSGRHIFLGIPSLFAYQCVHNI